MTDQSLHIITTVNALPREAIEAIANAYNGALGRETSVEPGHCQIIRLNRRHKR